MILLQSAGTFTPPKIPSARCVGYRPSAVPGVVSLRLLLTVVNLSFPMLVPFYTTQQY